MAHFMRRWMSAILAALILVTIAAPAALAASYTAYINGNTKVYQKASKSSRSMKVKKGMKCEVKDIDGKWACVEREGVTAYISVEDLDLKDRIRAYANRDTKVYKRASSSSASIKVAEGTEIYIVGCDDGYWKVETKNGKTTAFIKMSHATFGKAPEAERPDENDGGESSDSWKDKVVAMDWYEGGSSVLDRGDYATLYHCSTGITIRVKRMGGHNHADLEPATAEDTEKLLKISGGEFDWDSEAVILYSEGKYVACAINTMPHGNQTIDDNNYEGQFCLHMVNSRTHGSDTVNASHQKAIEKAYNWAKN